MKYITSISTATALLLSTTLAQATPITHMKVTGGFFSLNSGPTDNFLLIDGVTPGVGAFADMTIGGYDGSAPGSAIWTDWGIAYFEFGANGPVVVYTSESDAVNSGFAAPTGDITAGALTLELDSWTAWWGGTIFNQGSTSTKGLTETCVTANFATKCSTPVVVNAFDVSTGIFTTTWDSVVVGGAFNGQLGNWSVTGIVSLLKPGNVSLTVDHNSMGAETVDLLAAATAATTFGGCNTDSDPAKGTVTAGVTTNSCHYTPVADFIGTDTFTYTISDANFTETVTVNVTIRDSEDPVVTLNNSLNGNTTAVVKLNSGTYTDAGATALDNLDGVLTPTETSNNVVTTVETPDTTPYQVDWSATDVAGNTGTATRDVFVDGTGPVITVNVGPTTHEAATTYTDTGGATATDVIGVASGYSTLLSDDSASFDDMTLGAQDVTYTATDEAGNVSTATRTVTVNDTTGPTVTLSPTSVQYSVNDAYNDTLITDTAMDALEGDVSASCTNDSGTVSDMTTANSFTVTYTCEDTTGNTGTATATINVTAGNAPVITISGANPLTHEAGTAFSAPGATATDNEDGPITVPAPTGTVNVSSTGDYILTYSVVDSSGNPASADLVVQVRDTIIPVIVLNTPGDVSAIDHEINATFTDPGATVTDNFDTGISADVTGSVDVTVLGSTGNVRTYNASDISGNAAVTRTLTVTIVDTTNPAVTLIGGAVTVDQGSVYTDQGATVTDNSAETLTASCSAIDTSSVGVKTVTCTATDSSGNIGSVNRSVTVADVLAPVITLNGSDIDLNLDDTYTELGATALDNVDGTVPVTLSGTVNTSIPGTYTITYTASDSAPNTATATRNVNVIDNIGPVIILNGVNPMSVNAGDTYFEPGATATDNINGALTVTITGTVDTTSLGSYTITYSATDSAVSPNTTTITRTVNVVDESTPTLLLNGIGTIYMAIGDTYTEEGATAFDNLDGDLTNSIIVTSDNADLLIATGESITLSTAGTYSIVYSVTDSESQTSTGTRTITVAALASNTPVDDESTLESFGCSMTDAPVKPMDHSEWILIAGFLGFMSVKRRKANNKK